MGGIQGNNGGGEVGSQGEGGSEGVNIVGDNVDTVVTLADKLAAAQRRIAELEVLD